MKIHFTDGVVDAIDGIGMGTRLHDFPTKAIKALIYSVYGDGVMIVNGHYDTDINHWFPASDALQEVADHYKKMAAARRETEHNGTVAMDGAGEPSLKRFAVHASGELRVHPQGYYMAHDDYASLLKAYRDLDKAHAALHSAHTELAIKFNTEKEHADMVHEANEGLGVVISELGAKLDALTTKPDAEHRYTIKFDYVGDGRVEITSYSDPHGAWVQAGDYAKLEEGFNKLDAELATMTAERDDAAKMRNHYTALTNFWFNKAQRIERHVKFMQRMVVNYLQPGRYTDHRGVEHITSADTCKAFAGDMIYMLDGPEQRAAMAVGPDVPSDHIELIKFNEELQAANGRLTLHLASANKEAETYANLAGDRLGRIEELEAGFKDLSVANTKLQLSRDHYRQLVDNVKADLAAYTSTGQLPTMENSTIFADGGMSHTLHFEPIVGIEEPQHRAVFECTFEYANANPKEVSEAITALVSIGNGYVKVVTND